MNTLRLIFIVKLFIIILNTRSSFCALPTINACLEVDNMKDRNHSPINRREFLARSAAAAAAVSAVPAGLFAAGGSRFHPVPASPLPTRLLGKTGARVPILTFGSGSRWLMYEEEEGLRVMNEAIDSGIIYLDTARNYGDGESERRIGLLMPERRKQVLVQTKIAERDPSKFRKTLESSLTRLKCDYVDTCLIHSLEQADDLDRVEKGVVQELQKAKEEGLVRWIGISSHTSGAVLARFISRQPVDVVQCGLNVATNGSRDMGFEEQVLPLAVEKGLGVIAMKVMGQDQIVGKYQSFDAATCLRYTLSLPVSTATVGMPKPEHLKQNLELVRSFKPFSPEEMQAVKEKARAEIQTSFHEFMRGHSDLA